MKDDREQDVRDEVEEIEDEVDVDVRDGDKLEFQHESDMSDLENINYEAELAQRDIALLQNKAFKQLLSLSE